MKNDVAIEISNLSKTYKLGSISTKTFFSDIKVFLKKFHLFGEKIDSDNQLNTIYALKKINLCHRKFNIHELYIQKTLYQQKFDEIWRARAQGEHRARKARQRRPGRRGNESRSEACG